jgi:pimeloyl-ACP methyl ester carboxylesterase
MQTAAPAAGHRRWLWATIAVAALLVLGLLAGAALSWHFSSAVVAPDHSSWPEDISVAAVRPGAVSLERTEATGRPGYIGLVWQGGHAIAGPVLAEDEETVTRRLIRVDGYLVRDLEVATGRVFEGDPHQARGLPFADVEVKGELGPMPAWLVPPRPDPPANTSPAPATWAIFVHGINSNRDDGLRLVPLMRREGLASLLISYREDLGAPDSPDGHHHMGLTEWRDLESAARFALGHGARRLVLVGYSMGGAIVTQFMERSPLADRAAALILDAPALDWRAILEFNATDMGLPGFLALPVEWAIGARIDADWESLEAVDHADDLRLPILLFHGTEDELIPIETSDEFAAELPGRVTYYRVPEAEHTQAWNVDPRLYERRVSRFLEKSLHIPPKLTAHRP